MSRPNSFLLSAPPTAVRIGFACRCAIILTATLLAAALLAADVHAVETVTFKSEKDDFTNGVPLPTRTVTGEILIQAQDGGLLLQSDDGRMWTIQPEQITDRKTDDRPLEPLSADEIAKRLQDELPDGFRVYRTAHYIILHNTSDAYVRQVGQLFEQLYKGFYAFWKNRRWRLRRPEYPLVALVLADKSDFLKYASSEVGGAAGEVLGYYHLSSNRMTMFFMPRLERNVATIVHEATHQLAYNCGVQKRFADNPVWVSEGMAMYFESPNFHAASGWQGIGEINHVNLKRWHDYVSVRPTDSLVKLISDDERFRTAETATSAYGESWAFTFFLIRTHKKEYAEYLRRLSDGKPKAKLSPRERVQMFEQVFEKSISDIDKEFVRYMSKEFARYMVRF